MAVMVTLDDKVVAVTWLKGGRRLAGLWEEYKLDKIKEER